MLGVILLSLLLSSGNSWILQSTHYNVIPRLTSGVTLQCSNNEHKDVRADIGQLSRIRILKQIETGTWETYAQVIGPNDPIVSLASPNTLGIVGSGSLGRHNESFMSVTWSTTSEDTVGSYKCEVDGFAINTGTDLHVNTNIVNITYSAPSSHELVDIIISLHQKAEETMESVKEMEERLEKKMNKRLEEMKKEFQTAVEANTLEARYWPKGQFTLLMPASGCPNTSSYEFSNLRSKIESNSKLRPNHVFPAHLQDIFERCGTRNYLNFDFCGSSDRNPEKLPSSWPQGKYCIHTKTSSSSVRCPVGFQYSNFESYQISSSDIIGTEENTLDAVNWNIAKKILYFNYCCRDDGDHDVPIHLPTRKPFYLLRNKGKCQAVKNMDATEEWLQIDTDDSKTDVYWSGNPTVYPDGKLNDVRLELCYYTPRV